MSVKPLLVILVGIPGSGKSYFAKQLAPELGAVRLNGDSMKAAIYGSYEIIRAKNLIKEANQRGFAAIDYATEEVLRAGHSVVYDANNNKRVIRDKHRALAARQDAVAVVAWIRVPEAVAKERATTREKTTDQPMFDAALFDDVMKRQSANFDTPGADENCIEIDGTLPFKEQLAQFKDAIAELA